MCLHGYSDADHAADKTTSRSISGYVFFFAGGVISAQSKLQKPVANSTTESEYYALGLAAAEAAWLRQMLFELGYRNSDAKTVKIYGDNQGSLALTDNPEIHQRTKHIRVKFHYIRQQVTRKEIELWFIEGARQIADGFTKPLARPLYDLFA
jgi:hypothetical protein